MHRKSSVECITAMLFFAGRDDNDNGISAVAIRFTIADPARGRAERSDWDREGPAAGGRRRQQGQQPQEQRPPPRRAGTLFSAVVRFHGIDVIIDHSWLYGTLAHFEV